jgi:hypothetical protein
VLKDLKRLANDPKPVESLKEGSWKQLEVQHILKRFVNLFPGRLAVNVQRLYDIREPGLVVIDQKHHLYHKIP